MVENRDRRHILVDTGLEVLAQQGSRGLTHRAIDRAAELPLGTCVNYFRSRDALFQALGERIFERLTPSEQALDQARRAPPSRRRLIELMHQLMDRVMDQPSLQLALLELRLESTRRPVLAASLTKTLGTALELDLRFHHEAGLPGGRDEVVMLHLAINGLILNSLTLPEVLKVAGRAELVEQLVRRLVPERHLNPPV